jgi:cytochrome c553
MFEETKRQVCPIRAAGVALAALVAFLAPARAADTALGQYLAAECTTCHRLSGGPVGGIPAIAGLPQDRIAEALVAYKTGQRDNDVMRNIASRLSPDEIDALAAYFAAQKP